MSKGREAMTNKNMQQSVALPRPRGGGGRRHVGGARTRRKALLCQALGAASGGAGENDGALERSGQHLDCSSATAGGSPNLT